MSGGKTAGRRHPAADSHFGFKQPRPALARCNSPRGLHTMLTRPTADTLLGGAPPPDPPGPPSLWPAIAALSNSMLSAGLYSSSPGFSQPPAGLVPSGLVPAAPMVTGGVGLAGSPAADGDGTVSSVIAPSECPPTAWPSALCRFWLAGVGSDNAPWRAETRTRTSASETRSRWSRGCGIHVLTETEWVSASTWCHQCRGTNRRSPGPST